MLYLTDLRPCKWAMSHDPEDARIVQTSILVPLSTSEQAVHGLLFCICRLTSFQWYAAASSMHAR